MHPIRVGIQITQQHATYPQIRDAWKRVDESGADTLFNWDHFFPLAGDLDGMHLDNWTALGAMAEVTKRVQFGCLVAARGTQPAMLADRARSLDHFSNGRFILGIGSGWNQRDYEEYGYEFGTAASRLKDLDRDMKIIMDRLGKLNPPPIRPAADYDRRRWRESDAANRGRVRDDLERAVRAGVSCATRIKCWTSGARKLGAIRTRSNDRCRSPGRSSTSWTSTTTPG